MKKFLAGLACGLALIGSAQAQKVDFPSKPVKLIVGYAPGGGADVVARVVGQALGEAWKQQIVVINQSGASGMIAASAVVRSEPDGYTLLLGYTPEVSINKLLYTTMSYDPEMDLHPISMVANAPLIMVAGPSAKIQSHKDLSRSGSGYTFASPGTGSQQHLAGELLALEAKLPLRHIPYKSGAAAVHDVVGGRVDLFFATPPLLIPLVSAGKLNAIFVASSQRSSVMPEVPSADEVGLRGFNIDNWFALYGPKGMDPALAQKVGADLTRALANKHIEEQFTRQGFSAKTMSGKAFGDFVAAEMKKYAALIKRANLQPQ